MANDSIHLLGSFGVSGRTMRALVAHGVRNIDTLTSMSESDVRKIRGIGAKGINEIKFALADRGESLGNLPSPTLLWEGTVPGTALRYRVARLGGRLIVTYRQGARWLPYTRDTGPVITAALLAVTAPVIEPEP